MPGQETLAVSLTSRNGTFVRFGADEETQVLLSASFSTARRGGFTGGNFTIPRPTQYETVKASDFQSLRLYIAETDQTLYAGRVTGISQVDDTTIEVETEGWSNHLFDNKGAREIFIDRDVSKFGEDTVGRQLAIAQGSYKYNGTTTASEGTIKQEFTELSVPAYNITEATYYSGGVRIGKLRYDTAVVAGIGAGDTNWNMEAFLSADGVHAVTASGDLNATATTNQVLNATATAYYAEFYTAYVAAIKFNEYPFVWVWNNVCVLGTHGLPERGTWPQIGFYVSDMVPYILGKWAPLLEYTTGYGGTVEPTQFVVKQASFSEFTTAGAMLETLSGYGGSSNWAQDFGCYGKTGKEFYMREPGTYGKTWIARRDQAAEDSSIGPDSSELLNGCIVTFEPNGTYQQSVGPIGSGCQVETAALEDTSVTNPANTDGAKHWEVIGAGKADLAGAELIGRLTLASRNTRIWRGSITFKDQVEDEAGNMFPVGMIRAGDYVIVADDEDTAPRLIESTSFTPGQVSADIGAPPDELQTYLARVQENQEALGIG